MKKILLVILVIAASLFAQVKIDRGVDAVFPRELWNFEEYSRTEDCQTYLRLENADDSLGCFNRENVVCQSLLDSSVFFYWSQAWTSEANGYFYHLSDATHSILDVIMDEFRHYHDCGLIVATETGMDSIEFILKRDLQPALDSVTFDIGYFFMYSYRRSLDGSSQPAFTNVGELPVPQSDYVDSVVNMRNGNTLAIFSPVLRNNGFRGVRVERAGRKIQVRDGRGGLQNDRGVDGSPNNKLFRVNGEMVK
ncbi:MULTISPECIES: hypothetical protein [unclassified Fibrobacter]|uniref:hypothetical protein n=1 Tax=unclassified Fibrobacter TaxID=2634177 RepID=UPI000D6D1F33|nr:MULTISPECIES: hypothetical protein [unclassified Fibrobacter]PWJ62299.1 hypothetical protein BGX12_12226 [Fibrobacter sp. UWR4]PZW67991.1 hypothetical protein C8E88_102227 [Fibrobacter sp. UWR1]